MIIQIDGNSLTLDQVYQCAYRNAVITLSNAGLDNLKRSRSNLENVVASSKPIYGVNTGFGIFSDRLIPIEDARKLSRNLILSHAVGTGAPLAPEIVRAAMLIRANTLAKGYSGIEPALVQSILDVLNHGLTPHIPSQGSLGSSGDLALLAHMALLLSTDDEDKEEFSGSAYLNGERMSGKQAMERCGIKRRILGYKDGLALINGATFSCAIAALLVTMSHSIIDLADDITGMTMEALHGCSSALDNRIHIVRGHSGQIDSAQRIAQGIKGSNLIDKENKVQDAYSLRCAPQVHGAVRDVIQFIKMVTGREINAATDNPLVFSSSEVLSGGNFHGEPVGFGMDFLSIALAEMGAISERRIFRLLDPTLNNGLPPMLVNSSSHAGLQSGLMMPHYTAVSLVLENQTLAHPDSVHSLPTSGEQEDHNSNSMTAARHAWHIYHNLVRILAIEAYTAAHAIDLRLKYESGVSIGKGTSLLHQCIRSICKYHEQDTLWGEEIDRLAELFTKSELETAF